MSYSSIVKSVCALFGTFSCMSVYAQEIGVDYKGKSIFTYYTTNEHRVSVSADGSLTYTRLLSSEPAVYVLSSNKTDTTVVKNKFWALTTSLKTDEDLLSTNELNKLRPGLEVKFGRHTTIDSFDRFDQRLSDIEGSVQTFGVNVVGGFENILLYNSEMKMASKKYPLSFGVEGYWNFIFSKRDTARPTRTILALTGSLLRTWNDDDLLSYQDLSEATITDEIVAVEELAGRFGVLERNITRFRGSISVPMYYKRINPIPYAALDIKSASTPAYYFGLFTNILSQPLKHIKFQIPSSLGLGINWKVNKGEVSQPILSIKGEINF